MGKVLKLGLLFVVVVLAVLIGAMWWVSSHLDDIVARLIQEVGSEVAGVAVTVDDLDLSLREGHGEIRGLTIANPPGFESANALRLNRIVLELDLQSMGSDVFVVKSVDIDGATLSYETVAGKNNLSTIMHHLEGSGDDTDPDTEKQPGVAIERFALAGGRVTLIDDRLDQDMAIDVPEIVLTDIGDPRSGLPAAQAARQILGPVIGKIAGHSQDAARQALEDSAIGAIRDRIGGN